MFIKTKYLFAMSIIIHLKEILTCEVHNYIASIISLVLFLTKNQRQW